MKMAVKATSVDTISHHASSDTICLQCGDRGHADAFIYCVKCLQFAVHRYCLHVIPKSVNEFTRWVCDDCDGEVQNQPVQGNHGGACPDFDDDNVQNVKQESDIDETIFKAVAPRPVFKSDEHRANYTRLKKMEVVSSRYPHDETMEKMGIKDDVLKLFARINWTSVITNKWPTYPDLVLEFLASLHLNSVNRPYQPLSISFQLANQEFVLNRAELDALLGCPEGGAYSYPKEFDIHNFWRSITTDSDREKFDSPNNKALSINNPVLRYIQRTLSVSIFGRNEMSKARSYEVYVLWSMLAGRRVSLAACVIDQWRRVSVAKKGKIWCGGLITAVAVGLGVDLRCYEKLRTSRDIDLQQLRNMQMIALDSGRVLLKMADRGPFPLPNPYLTHVTDLQFTDNWKMDTQSHNALMQCGRRVRQRVEILSNEEDETRPSSQPEIKIPKSEPQQHQHFVAGSVSEGDPWPRMFAKIEDIARRQEMLFNLFEASQVAISSLSLDLREGQRRRDVIIDRLIIRVDEISTAQQQFQATQSHQVPKSQSQRSK